MTRKTTRYLGTAMATILVASTGISTSSMAQEQVLEEIIVTVQRRAERLRDVPVAVTALTSNQLVKQRINSLDALSAAVPALQVNSVIGENTPIFSLRGVSMSDYSLNQQGPIATYIDDVYRGSFPLLGLAMFDVERVEVLRGPQGTLYGKNTTGGAVKIITRAPSLDKAEGYVTAGIGNYKRREASGAVNIPLSDTTAIRVAGTMLHADGWFENQLPGRPSLNASREYGLRGSFLWEPSEGTSVILRASTSLQNPYNYGIRAEAGEYGVGAGLYWYYNSLYPDQNPNTDYFRTGLGDHEIESDFAPRRRNRANEVSLTAEFPVSDSLTLTSVSAWSEGDLFIPEESDGSPIRALELPQYGEATQYMQDLRLASDNSSGINYIIGGFYAHEKSDINNIFRAFVDIDANGDGAIDEVDCIESGYYICSYENSFEQIKSSFAAYADISFEPTDQITLTGGIRYTSDKGNQNDYKAIVSGIDGTPLFNMIPGSADLNATVGRESNSDNISGRVVLDYKISEDTLLYASVNRGYRGGAFNAQAYVSIDELTVATPETLLSYEVGAKGTLMENRLQYSASAFLYDYKNQQFLDIDTSALQRVVNIDKSRIMGAELELTMRPSDSLEIVTGISLLDSKIKAGILRGTDLQGRELPNAPKFSFSTSINWTFYDFSRGDLTLNLNGTFKSSQYFEAFNINRINQDSYALVNGQITYNDDESDLMVSVWVKNIFNKFYYTNRIDVLSYGFDYNHIGAPSTFGISLTKSF